MQYLSSWFTPLTKEQIMQHNATVIASFPDDESAQIKANIEGKLDLAGYGSWFSVQLGMSTELKGTVKAIKKTIKKMDEQWGKQDGNIEENLKQNRELFQGLQKILHVYKARYPDAEKNPQITKLENVVEVAKTKFMTHIENVQDRIGLKGEVAFSLGLIKG